MRNSGLTTMSGDIFHVEPVVQPLLGSAPLRHSQLNIVQSGDNIIVDMIGAKSDFSYNLQRSLDGRDWQTILSGLSVKEGHVIGIDDGAAQQFQRAFYRYQQN